MFSLNSTTRALSVRKKYSAKHAHTHTLKKKKHFIKILKTTILKDFGLEMFYTRCMIITM